MTSLILQLPLNILVFKKAKNAIDFFGSFLKTPSEA